MKPVRGDRGDSKPDFVPSITHVADRAGVSVGTVSRVMNGAAGVSPTLRRRVFLEARRLGYRPRTHVAHLALITGRHNPALPIGYTSVLSARIERWASRRKLVVDVISEESLDLVYDCRVSAVIGVVFCDRIGELKTIPNLPIITLNHPMSNQGIHSIYTDHFEQGVVATRHLVERGHRRIAFLADLPEEWGACQRADGYQHVLREAGLPVLPQLMRYGQTEPLYDILRRWIRDGATAILNFSEDASLEVLHLLSNVLGLRIGRDISTISLEDIPIYQYFSPPQTVIRQPLEEMARLAVDTALEHMGGPNGDGHGGEVVDACLHAELVERDSVANRPGERRRLRPDTEARTRASDPAAAQTPAAPERSAEAARCDREGPAPVRRRSANLRGPGAWSRPRATPDPEDEEDSSPKTE